MEIRTDGKSFRSFLKDVVCRKKSDINKRSRIEKNLIRQEEIIDWDIQYSNFNVYLCLSFK